MDTQIEVGLLNQLNRNGTDTGQDFHQRPDDDPSSGHQLNVLNFNGNVYAQGPQNQANANADLND